MHPGTFFSVLRGTEGTPVCPVRVEEAELLLQVLSNSLGATYSYSYEPRSRGSLMCSGDPGCFLVSWVAQVGSSKLLATLNFFKFTTYRDINVR